MTAERELNLFRCHTRPKADSTSGRDRKWSIRTTGSEKPETLSLWPLAGVPGNSHREGGDKCLSTSQLTAVPFPHASPFSLLVPTCPALQGDFAFKIYLWGRSKELGRNMSECLSAPKHSSTAEIQGIAAAIHFGAPGEKRGVVCPLSTYTLRGRR